MPAFINYNGKLINQEAPVIEANNRGLRYGDGLFETMRMLDGDIPLFAKHMERLFRGLALLQFDVPVHFTGNHIREEILRLCRRNKVEKKARVRLSVFRGKGGLFDPENLQPNYIIEAMPLPDNYLRLNENGLVVDIYSDVRKSCDLLANCKTNNYLPYVLAALYAKKNRLNDCLVLNQYERICDSSMANVFWIAKDVIYTTPLSEGCVAGIMRNHLMEKIKGAGFDMREALLDSAVIEQAGEVFLTNAAYGMRWVKQYRNTVFSNALIQKIYKEYLQTNGH